jgi:hypothetical protein
MAAKKISKEAKIMTDEARIAELKKAIAKAYDRGDSRAHLLASTELNKLLQK